MMSGIHPTGMGRPLGTRPVVKVHGGTAVGSARRGEAVREKSFNGCANGAAVQQGRAVNRSETGNSQEERTTSSSPAVLTIFLSERERGGSERERGRGRERAGGRQNNKEIESVCECVRMTTSRACTDTVRRVTLGRCDVVTDGTR